MEKPQLVNFIAKVLEDSGFKVYKNFKTSQQVIDIYAVLPTSIGDFGVVVACKNYDKEWEVGIDVLKEMEMVGKTLKASKVTIVTSSNFSQQAKRYAEEKKIKLVDRRNLIALAKRYSDKKKKEKQPARLERRVDENVNLADINNTDIHTDFKNRQSNQPERLNIDASDIDNPYYNQNEYYHDSLSSYGNRFKREYPSKSYYNQVYNPYDSYEEYEADINHYESAVGGVDLSGYSEYDDDLYREEFLNKTPDNTEFSNRQVLISGKVHQEEPKQSRFKRSNNKKNKPKFKSSRNSRLISRNRIPSRNKIKQNRKPTGEILRPLLSNIVVMIMLVVIISYLIAYLLANIGGVPNGYLGMIELIVAFLLSYGLALYTERSSDLLIKGTIVFFVSLIILMVLIVIL